MKKTLIALVVVCSLAVTAGASIVISEVMPGSSHEKDITNDNGDWFEITNTGSASVSIGGWEWVDDSSSHARIVFPQVTLTAGESVICLEEDDAADWLGSWNLGSSGLQVITEEDCGNFWGLSKDGDSVLLYDNTGVLVDSYTWTGSTNGYSIDVYHGGGNSQVGVHGAWASDDNGCTDVASPGLVPEPMTALLLGLGGLVFCRRS